MGLKLTQRAILPGKPFHKFSLLDFEIVLRLQFCSKIVETYFNVFLLRLAFLGRLYLIKLKNFMKVISEFVLEMRKNDRFCRLRK